MKTKAISVLFLATLADAGELKAIFAAGEYEGPFDAAGIKRQMEAMSHNIERLIWSMVFGLFQEVTLFSWRAIWHQGRIIIFDTQIATPPPRQP